MTYGTSTYGTIQYGQGSVDGDDSQFGSGGFGHESFGTGPFGDGPSDSSVSVQRRFGNNEFGTGGFGEPINESSLIDDDEDDTDATGYDETPFGDGPFGGSTSQISQQSADDTLSETAYFGGGNHGQGLYAFSNEQLDAIREGWNSGGIEFHPENDVWGLESAITTPVAFLSDDLVEINAAHHIDTAIDEELDKIGEIVDVQRETGETDPRYRARIKAAFRAAITGTTHEDVLEFVSTLLETPSERVNINWLPSVPGTALVSVFEADIMNASITVDDLEEFATQIVPAGHKIVVELRGTFRFDGDDVDISAEHGFSSDEFEGGTLSEII